MSKCSGPRPVCDPRRYETLGAAPRVEPLATACYINGMSRAPLVIGAIVVVVAAVALVILLGGDDDAATSSESMATPATQAKPVTPPPLERNPSVTVADMPRMPGGTQPSLPQGGEHPREYAVGDVRVRDHRAGDNQPLDIPPNVHPANARLIPSSLTHAISSKLQAVVRECAASLPREGRGAKPRLEGQIWVSITSQQMSVTEAIVQLRDLPEGTAIDAAKQCVQTRAIGLATPAADEADLERYSIRVSYALP